MTNSQSKTSLNQLHLGLGSFHRAHQAMYMQNLHDIGETQWQIIAGNIQTRHAVCGRQSKISG